MAAKEIFFEPTHNILGGYYIPVRNNWNYKIIKRHISEADKKNYEKEIGEEIITDDDFFNWWKKIHSNQKIKQYN